MYSKYFQNENEIQICEDSGDSNCDDVVRDPSYSPEEENVGHYYCTYSIALYVHIKHAHTGVCLTTAIYALLHISTVFSL